MTWKTTNTAKGGNKLYSDAKGILPSLDLRFAEGKNLNDYITGKNLITFSRDTSSGKSAGTYVDSTGVIRTSKINLVTYSEEFDNASQQGWVFNNISRTGGQSDPNGNTSAYLFDDGTLGSYHAVQGGASNRPTIGDNQNITASVFVKAGSARYLFLGCGFNADGFAVVFDTQTNTLGSPAAFGTATIVGTPTVTPYSGGWYRISVSGVFSNTSPRLISIGINDSSTLAIYYGNSYTGANNTGYFWGAQLEEGSTASPYIKTTNLPSAAPRFDHDPTTGESLGLLIEESRTNLMTYSEEFDNNAAWVKYLDVTVTQDTTTSPAGTTTADSLTANVNSGTIWQNFPFATNTTYTGTVYAKPNGRNFIRLRGFFGNAIDQIFDLSSGSPGVSGNSTGNALVPTIDPVGNGWYRCRVTFTTPAGATSGNFSFTSEGANSLTYVSGDNTTGCYIWGAQLEGGSFATSYIPTSGSTVTRAADVASITGSNFSSWYNQSEGTLFADFIWRKSSANNYSFPWYIEENTSNGVYLGNWGGTTQRLGVRYNDPTVLFNVDIPNTLEGTQCRTATALKSNDFAATSNGGAIASYTGSLLASNMNKLDIMQLSGSYHAIGTISRLTYFPERLPDTTLQAITS